MVLLISEDKDIADFFYEYLKLHNYKFNYLSDRKKIEELVEDIIFDVVIINLEQSREHLIYLEKHKPELPLIILTDKPDDLKKQDNVLHSYFLKEQLKLESITIKLNSIENIKR